MQSIAGQIEIPNSLRCIKSRQSALNFGAKISTYQARIAGFENSLQAAVIKAPDQITIVNYQLSLVKWEALRERCGGDRNCVQRGWLIEPEERPAAIHRLNAGPEAHKREITSVNAGAGVKRGIGFEGLNRISGKGLIETLETAELAPLVAATRPKSCRFLKVFAYRCTIGQGRQPPAGQAGDIDTRRRSHKSLPDDGDEEVNGHSNPDPGLHGVLTLAVKHFDTQVLFDAFEEEFHLPAGLVTPGDGKSG
jgi:hypothetical protein